MIPGIGTSGFKGKSGPASGKYRVAALGSVGVKMTSDFGATWALLTVPNYTPRSAAISGDGKYIVVGQTGKGIYYSNDYGVTWTWLAAYRTATITKLCISLNGTVIMAMLSGYATISTDSGANFTIKTDVSEIIDIDMSVTGQYMVRVSSDYCLTSSNTGSSWNYQLDSSGPFYTCSLSSNGKNSIVTAYSGLYKANNYFNYTWTNSNSFLGGDISDDGLRITTAVWNGSIYVSVNYAINWTIISTYIYSRTIELSNDGKYQSISAYDQTNIRLSSDFGATWQSLDFGTNCLTMSFGKI